MVTKANYDRTEKKLLHYTGKAIADYNMIETGDKVLVCLSGGKDSYTLLKILYFLQRRTHNKFTVFALTVDQGQPGWQGEKLKAWLEESGIPHEIILRKTYPIVLEKAISGKTYCALCSRLRRGVIYSYAKEHGFTKIALGHHRDDLIESILMSMLYSGAMRSMPPKLRSQDKAHIVIRPLAYCQEKDIAEYAEKKAFPIVPCGLCSNQKKSMRRETKELIKQLAAQNPKIPGNILNSMRNICPSQLMDHNFWDFKGLKVEE